MNLMKDIILLLRPQQWLKNSFVFLPLFFHGDLANIPLLSRAFVAFLCYSFAASSIYCFNDIHDVEADRKHPVKCKRPIAAGRISVSSAYGIMGFMALLSLLVAYSGLGECRLEAMGVIGFYYLMNLAYCVRLKQLALVDMFVIALGFVLRVVLGGISVGVELSHWIVVMTFLLALFLALAKRRDDVVLYAESGVTPRKNVNRYNLEFMNQCLTVVSAVMLVAYILYTVSDEVMTRFGSHYVYLTTVFVLAGVIRYMQITIVDKKSGSPTKVLVKDHFIQLCIVGWVAAFLVLIYLK